jgi:hypothetical protein
VAVRGNVANYGAFGMEDIDYTRIGSPPERDTFAAMSTKEVRPISARRLALRASTFDELLTTTSSPSLG